MKFAKYITIGIVLFGILFACCDLDSTTDTTAANDSTTPEVQTTIPFSSHEHIFANATCIAPKTCTFCGITEGDPTGHSWNDATCTTSKTCSNCGEASGNPAGHNWKAADCTAPKTCQRCNATEGSPTGHNWKDATYGSPKRCTKCGLTEGSPLEKPGGENYHGHVYTGGSSSKKYHYEADCAGKNSHEITWDEVERRGLGPCGTCVLK